jgi:transcriptional regulator with XRE-family HTH domain
MIGNRLKEERLKLGLNQTALGKIGGVQKASQIAYEKEERFPDARYLTALHKYGIDIYYVLIGEKSPSPVSRLDKNVILPVATAALTWLQTTEREVTPELLANILTILYDAASHGLGEEHLSDQLRAVI